MSDSIRNPDHERIWLQHAEGEMGRTWCQDQIDESDTEYIRADLVPERPVKVADELLGSQDAITKHPWKKRPDENAGADIARATRIRAHEDREFLSQFDRAIAAVEVAATEILGGEALLGGTVRFCEDQTDE